MSIVTLASNSACTIPSFAISVGTENSWVQTALFSVAVIALWILELYSSSSSSYSPKYNTIFGIVSSTGSSLSIEAMPSEKVAVTVTSISPLA